MRRHKISDGDLSSDVCASDLFGIARVVISVQAEGGIRDLIVTGVQTCALLFSSRRRHTRSDRDWSSDVCSSDLLEANFRKFTADWTKRRDFVNLYGNLDPAQYVDRLARNAGLSLQAAEREDLIGALSNKIGRASCRERV